MSTETELKMLVAEILEPHLQFYRAGPTDKERYFVGPEVLQALGWVITSIVIPILVSGASEIVKDKIKEWLHTAEEGKESVPEALRVHANTLTATAGLVTNEQSSQASEFVAEYLSLRGWPAPLAAADAAEIVEAMRRRLNAGK